MPVGSTTAIALAIGDKSFSELPLNDQTRINQYLTEVESVLSNPPWNFRLLSSAVTEFLPQSGARSVDSLELEQYEEVGGLVVPIDDQTSRSRLQLTHTPVLLTGLQVWEDSEGYAGQGGSTPFGNDTLLTLGTDYYLDANQAGISDSGALLKITGGGWSRVPRSIKVTYIGGPAAAYAAGLGVSFLPILKQVIESAVVDRYAAWARMRKSIASDNPGLELKSESIGKWSGSYGPVGGMGMGQSLEILPSYLAEQLTPFVNVGALLRR